MKAKPILPSVFSKLFNYNPETGEITWRVAISIQKPGGVAGTRKTNKRGRSLGIVIAYKKSHYGAHRIAWVLANQAEIPDGMLIDHMNGDPCDNRLSNLRLATSTINNQNIRCAGSRSASGLLGATWNKHDKAWTAAIVVNKVKRFIGGFKTKEEAHAAYIKAKRQLHEGCTI